MNLGQTMITAGLFVLLVMTVISANRMLIQTTESTLQSEALEVSAAVAEDLIAEASAKKFDVNANDYGTQQPWEFGSCGCSSWEYSAVSPLPDRSPFKSATVFNDFDDYEGYERVVDAGGISGFVVKSYVYYVDPLYPDIPSYWQSYFKKMEVRVSHPKYILDEDGLPTEIVYTTLMSY